MKHDPTPEETDAQMKRYIKTATPAQLLALSDFIRSTKEADSKSLTITAAVDDVRYIGRICDKHPEKNGLRRRRTHACVACENEYRKKSAQRPEAKEARRKRLQNKRDGVRLDEAMKLVIRRRAVELYLRSGGNPNIAATQYGPFWNTARTQLIAEHRARHGEGAYTPLEETDEHTET